MKRLKDKVIKNVVEVLSQLDRLQHGDPGLAQAYKSLEKRYGRTIEQLRADVASYQESLRKQAPTKFRQQLNVTFDHDTLQQAYRAFWPAGSGPLFCMKYIEALIEEVAELKGIIITPEWHKRT